jgi:hypothetical protein
MSESPIGSIIAFGGQVTREWELANGWLRCDGRLLDKTQPEYTALFEAIVFAWGGDGDTMFNVPDLRGFFLRGVDNAVDPETPQRVRDEKDSKDKVLHEQVPYPVDPDRDTRIPYRPGGAQGKWVGSVQLPATAKPKVPFKTTSFGGHSHSLPFEINAGRDVDDQKNTVAYPHQSGSPFAYTDDHGFHSHDVGEGGDLETRPINAYVHWIIRYK